MDQDTVVNLLLVLVFVLVGGVFAGTEIALVSLRESQVDQLEKQSKRGAKVAAVARDPNRFLAAVQIGVTVAGFFSAAYGASTLAPDFVPVLTGLGLSDALADTVSVVALTLRRGLPLAGARRAGAQAAGAAAGGRARAAGRAAAGPFRAADAPGDLAALEVDRRRRPAPAGGPAARRRRR